MPSLNRIKASVAVGQVYDVTNHYITRQDHPAYGTTRRTVVKTTGSSAYLAYGEFPGEAALGAAQPPWPTFKWPAAAQVQQDPDGTIRLYGMYAGSKPADLFLTLTPVRGIDDDDEPCLKCGGTGRFEYDETAPGTGPCDECQEH